METICAIEVDRCRVATIRHHSPHIEIINSDIRQAKFSDYKDQVGVAYGGPPCQPFSPGGLRRAEADERNMIREFVRIVWAVERSAFLMENVPGLVVADRMEYLSPVIEGLEDLGFIVNWQILNAANCSVPQKRQPLFVVGPRHAQFKFPEPNYHAG